MPVYKRFEDLPVWLKAKELAIATYRAVDGKPFSRDYALVGQITRAAVSVSSNIAEGFERETTREFIRYLYVARGSCGEVRSQLYIAKELGYIDDRPYADLHRMCLDVSRQLGGLIEYLQRGKPPKPQSSP